MDRACMMREEAGNSYEILIRKHVGKVPYLT
jgi:hypothetical protein